MRGASWRAEIRSCSFVAGSRGNRVLLEVTRIASLVPVFNSVEEASRLSARLQQRTTLKISVRTNLKKPVVECVNESDRPQIFKMLLDCPVGERISDLERDASLGKSSRSPASPTSASQHNRAEGGRSVAGCAAIPALQPRTQSQQPATAPFRRSCWSEGRQRERSSSGPASGRSSGACPSARSSITADQGGVGGGRELQSVLLSLCRREVRRGRLVLQRLQLVRKFSLTMKHEASKHETRSMNTT